MTFALGTRLATTGSLLLKSLALVTPDAVWGTCRPRCLLGVSGEEWPRQLNPVVRASTHAFTGHVWLPTTFSIAVRRLIPRGH